MEVDIEVLAQTANAARYRLRFSEVADLELGGINEQNVLFDLVADRDGDVWSVEFRPAYGMGATFRCGRVEADRIT